MKKIILTLALALVMGLAYPTNAWSAAECVRFVEVTHRQALIKEAGHFELPADWKEQIEAVVRQRMRDPDSTQFRFSREPLRSYEEKFGNEVRTSTMWATNNLQAMTYSLASHFLRGFFVIDN